MAGTYIYTKASVNEQKMTLEIEAEEFSQTLTYISNDGSGSDNLTVQFVADLTSPEVTTLNALVVAHDGNPPTFYPRLCRHCWKNQSIPGIVEPVECPCCEKIDCLIPIDDTEFINEEVFEHFLDQLVDIVSMVGGAKLIGNLIIANSALIEKEDNTTLKLATASGIGADMEVYGLKSHNPSDYTFYQFVWKWHLDAVDIQNTYIGLIDTPFAETESCLIEKSATAGDIKFITTADGISFTTTDNITVDITVEHEYAIKIKSGKVEFYIDSVLKATHTTNIPYNVADGMSFINYIESSAANSREWYCDLLKVLLRRAF